MDFFFLHVSFKQSLKGLKAFKVLHLRAKLLHHKKKKCENEKGGKVHSKLRRDERLNYLHLRPRKYAHYELMQKSKRTNVEMYHSCTAGLDIRTTTN